MANRPQSWSNEQWEKHLADSKAEARARARVEGNPTEVMMDFERRIAALEGRASAKPKPAPAAPAAKRARR